MRTGIKFENVWAAFSSTLLDEKNVPKEQPVSLIEGIRIEEKKNWWGLSAKNGNTVYVAKQKLVRQIDLSGFGKGWVGTEKLRSTNGRVQAHLDLSDENALFHLTEILKVMVVTATEEKKRVSPFGASSKPKAPKPVDAKSDPISSLGDAKAAQERLDRLVKIATMRGTPLSGKTIAELVSKGAVLPPGTEVYGSDTHLGLDKQVVNADEEDDSNGEVETAAEIEAKFASAE